MRRRGQRGSRAWRDALVNGGAIAPVLAAERHYLQFDGVGDCAVADAVFGGIGSVYTIAIKADGRITTANGVYMSTGGPSTASLASYDRIYATAGNAISFASFTQAAGIVSASSPGDTTGGRLVASWCVSTVGGATAHSRLVVGGVVVGTADLVQANAQTKPDHVTVGARVKDDLVTRSNFGDLKFISAVLVDGNIPDAELAAWLAADDAEGVISNIDHYWAASDLSGSSIPARLGTVALTVSGPTVSDLVAL